MSDVPFLSRWSRLKKASARAAQGDDAASPAPAPAPPVASVPDRPLPAADAQGEAPALPPVESLTPESDFAPFMRAKVEESVKRRALKTLFQDPRFNVMDGLDVYTGDYSAADPLPEGWLEKMSQVAHLGDQPARVEQERQDAERAAVAAAGASPEAGHSPPAGEGAATSPGMLPSDTPDQVDASSRVGYRGTKAID